MSTPDIDVRPDHWETVRGILRKHVPQYEVWAFGSRAKWTAKEYSDLDLTVITDKPLPLALSAALAEDFSESDLPWKVDVVDWAVTGEDFRRVIERGSIVVQRPQLSASWKTVRLEELAAPINGAIAIGPFGSRLKAASYVSVGVSVIRGTNLGGKTLSGNFVFITPAKAAELGNANLRPDDLVFPHRGAIGEVGIVPNDGRSYVLSTSLMKITIDKTRADPEFLYYFFKSDAGRFELLKNASQVGTPGISTPLQSLRACLVPNPPLEVQREIAACLRSIDDRIDNLREGNTTLEAAAAALFKAWFVDFSNVSPQDMKESELGLIPKGWAVASFAELVDIVSGGTPKTSVTEFWKGDIPWFTVADAPVAGQVFVLDTEKRITQLGLDSCASELVPSYTTIISARGTVGKVAMTGVPMTLNQSCYGLRPKFEDGEAFVYFLTLHFIEGLKRIAHGAVFDTITKDSFSQMATSAPPADVVSAFAQSVAPLLERVRTNRQMEFALATTRDSILPRLLAGRLHLLEPKRV